MPEGAERPRAPVPGAGASGGRFDPKEMVEYAAGAVVSRTLFKGGGGTVTLFAFDAGQDLSEHTSPLEAFVQILEGRAEITVGGQKMDSPEGTMIRMPADVPHAVRAIERFKMLLVLLRA